ncbi:hypothetical protein Purlil1_14153 [Purpureocillium lilacinum]|uniref:Protein kinase domain-containing protein n=1 Tax=Purpureocillium lilacinum TaxID=33203 RepID=A0ABR0BC38_PURLI|nr:hypothetical protein Purlil1_14153 [Purpureocillium lilacinum]
MAILLLLKVWRKWTRVFCVMKPAYTTDCETYKGYAGRPLNHIDDSLDPGIITHIPEAFAAMHRRRVLHQDAELRNMLYDGKNVMIVDFERANIHERPALGPIGPNGHSRKRKRIDKQQAHDLFTQEMDSVRFSLAKLVGHTK